MRRQAMTVICFMAAVSCAIVAVVTLLQAPSRSERACRDWAADHGYVDPEHKFGKGDNCTARDASGAFVSTRTEAPWTTTFLMWVACAAAAALGLAGVGFATSRRNRHITAGW